MNTVVDFPKTAQEAEALFNKAGKVLGTPKVAKTPVKEEVVINLPEGTNLKKRTMTTAKKAKKIGVVGISKAENQQLGLLIKWIALELDWDTIPNDVLVNPEALTKLIGRYRENG